MINAYLRSLLCSLAFLAQSNMYPQLLAPRFVGEEQRPVGSDSKSRIVSYRIGNGKLVPDGRMDQFADQIDSVVQLGRYFFITYSEVDRRYIRIFDGFKGSYGESIDPGIEAEIVLDYSFSEDGSYCANWPIYHEPWQVDEKTQRWLAKAPDLDSVCTGATKEPRLLHNQWEQVRQIVWPGAYIGNVGNCLLHQRSKTAIPPVLGAPPVPIIGVPDALALDLPRDVIDVAGANRRYLALRSMYGDSSKLYVYDRMQSTWKMMQVNGQTFRIFGDFLVAYDQTCDDPSENKEQRMTCIPSALRVVSLADGRSTELPKSSDSDVLAIAQDGVMIYREGTAIFKTRLGQPLDRSRDLLVRSETAETIRWAY